MCRLICVDLPRRATVHRSGRRRFGQPRVRNVDSNPRRFAVACCQTASPKGVPTWALRRNAFEFGLLLGLSPIVQPVLSGAERPIGKCHACAPVDSVPQARPTPRLSRPWSHCLLPGVYRLPQFAVLGCFGSKGHRVLNRLVINCHWAVVSCHWSFGGAGRGFIVGGVPVLRWFRKSRRLGRGLLGSVRRTWFAPGRDRRRARNRTRH